MSYFLLPINNNIINNDDFYIKLTNNSNQTNYISHTLNEYILKNKSKIEQVQQDWDNLKKFINPYEFIHTPIPNYKTSVAKYKPISRSYFKFIEISSMLQLLDNFNDKNLTSFHLAEGPGGFIEALANLRKNSNDKYFGITLISNNSNIPGWKKSIELFKKYPNIILEKGITETGDILESKNYLYCCNKYKNSKDLITADGGFDFSIDFNLQEELSSKLIFTEIIYAISLQKYNGHFILKIFDSFKKSTAEILYLLTCFYEKVYIVKPNTSRYANSEKYIVCKNFKLKNTEFLFNDFSNFINNFTDYKYIDSILKFNLPYIFINRLEEINSIIGQQQIESINNTLTLINHKNKNEKLDQLKSNNINKCCNWCIKYKQPYYKIITQSNIFITPPE